MITPRVLWRLKSDSAQAYTDRVLAHNEKKNLLPIPHYLPEADISTGTQNIFIRSSGRLRNAQQQQKINGS